VSSKVKVREPAEKEFAKTFDSLCEARSRWNIWNDFVHLSAYTLSNAIDPIHREKREKDYMTMCSGYSEKEMLAFSELFGIVTTALEDDPNQDFLGRMYMMLDLGNKNTGQFFTPYNVSKMCAVLSSGVDELTEEIEKCHYTTAHDCCIGGGAMLIGLANALREQDINYQRKVMFIAQDIDHTCCCMAYIQLSLLGCPGYVVCGNSLTEPLTGDPLFAPMDRETFITPMYLAFDWEFRRRYHLMMKAMGIKASKTTSEIILPSNNKEPYPKVENAVANLLGHCTRKFLTGHTPETNIGNDKSPDGNLDSKPVQMTFFD